METFCDATHDNAVEGCFGKPEHEGKHWSWDISVVDTAHPDGAFDYPKWYWGDEPAETFTDEELAILITALQPVKHFFPGLEAKLHRARAAVQ